MSDEALSRALATLEANRKEMDQLEAQASTIQERLGALRDNTAKVETFVEVYKAFSIPEPPEEEEGTGSKKSMIAGAAISIMKKLGDPIPLKDLYAAIEESGVDIGTQNPKQYLSTTLHRDGRFESLPGQGWRVRS